MSNKKLPMWIEDNAISFSCTECGKCCTGDPGFVFLEESDIERLCLHLNISAELFLKKYCKKVGAKYSLIEKDNFACIFFEENKKTCSLYQARPKQCRTYPFWDSVIASKRSWDKEKKYCEGINIQDGKKFTKEEIEKIISK